MRREVIKNGERKEADLDWMMDIVYYTQTHSW